MLSSSLIPRRSVMTEHLGTRLLLSSLDFLHLYSIRTAGRTAVWKPLPFVEWDLSCETCTESTSIPVCPPPQELLFLNPRVQHHASLVSTTATKKARAHWRRNKDKSCSVSVHRLHNVSVTLTSNYCRK